MRALSQINVIPFIDIMLVLLAVVLTTATFVAQGRIPVDLPQATQAEGVQDIQALELTIDRDGVLYVDDRVLTLQQFSQQLEALSQQVPLRMRVDSAVAFEHFVGVIDLLKSRDMHNVSIITERDGA